MMNLSQKYYKITYIARRIQPMQKAVQVNSSVREEGKNENF